MGVQWRSSLVWGATPQTDTQTRTVPKNTHFHRAFLGVGGVDVAALPLGIEVLQNATVEFPEEVRFRASFVSTSWRPNHSTGWVVDVASGIVVDGAARPMLYDARI